MASPELVAAILAILPAGGAMWYFLTRFEGYFDERRMFLTLLLGMVAGAAVGFLEGRVLRFNDPDSIQQFGLVFTLSYFVFGYAAVESLAKGALLGLKRFRGRKDTPYYGVSVGLAFGATLGMAHAGIVLSRLAAGRPAGIGLAEGWHVLTLFAYYAGATLTHAATGALVAKGPAEGRFGKWVALAALLQTPILLFGYFRTPAEVPPYGMQPWLGPLVELSVLSLVYGVMVFVLVQRRVLDRIVPPDIRRQVDQARRREARKAKQDE